MIYFEYMFRSGMINYLCYKIVQVDTNSHLTIDLFDELNSIECEKQWKELLFESKEMTMLIDTIRQLFQLLKNDWFDLSSTICFDEPF